MPLYEHVEPREGMAVVFSPTGSYLGCIGLETWQRLCDMEECGFTSKALAECVRSWQGPFQYFAQEYAWSVVEPRLRAERERSWSQLHPAPPPPKKRRRSKSSWRKTAEALAWAKAVKARDGECMSCGSSDRLHAHHIDTSSSKRFDLDNGVALCISCHRKAHPHLPEKMFL